MKKKHVGRQLSHDVLEEYRFRAVKLREDGWLLQDIADAFGVGLRAVSRWLTDYKREGRDGLKCRIHVGPKPKLDSNEVARLLELLKKDAMQYGFQTPLWTCKRVAWLINREFGKKLHESNVWRLLGRWGLSNQKPERRAKELDDAGVKYWLRFQWPKIKEHTRRWRALLYFQDESGVSLTPNLGKTWGVKGTTPIVRVTGHRGGFCVSSVISTSGRLLFQIEKATVNSTTFVDFLAKVRAHHPSRKIVMVTDNAPAHVAKKVANFVHDHKKKFALYYLPPYSSSDLNPDENTWGYLKKNHLPAHQSTNITELKRTTKNALLSMQRKPALIRSFFYKINEP